MDNRNIEIFDMVDELQSACATRVADVLREATEDRNVTLALSGGSTPRKMHEMLARAEGIDWSKVHIFWGDERTVPPDHSDSNYRMARETLLDFIDIPAENVHRMAGELEPDEAARQYEEEIRQVFGLGPGEVPSFDVILLGMGPDGHTASLFPGTSALDEMTRLVVANGVPQMDTVRLTLTYPVLNNARLVLFVVAGKDKADAAVQCAFNPVPPPAGRVQPRNGELFWLLDAGAAARLGG